jgi:uncharacterized protein (TIGR03067 family)
MKFPIALALAFAILHPANAQDKPAAKKPTVLGEWFLAKETAGGDLATQLKANVSRVTIDSESIVAGRTAGYKLDDTKNQIDVVIDGGPKAEQGNYSGIYELKGDTLKIHLGLPGQPRPTGYEAKDKTVLIVLTRGKS